MEATKLQNFSKGENMSLIHFSIPQLPGTQQRIRKHSKQTDVRHQITEGLLGTLQESFLGPFLVSPCVLKVVLVSLVTWFYCPSSWKNESERKEETPKGRYNT